MARCQLAIAITFLLVAGCGPPAEHVQAPTLPEPEPEAEPVDQSAADDSEPSDSEASPPDAEQPEPEPSLPPVEPQRTCAGLSEKTCKVTEGCAWSTTEDCIDQ